MIRLDMRVSSSVLLMTRNSRLVMITMQKFCQRQPLGNGKCVVPIRPDYVQKSKTMNNGSSSAKENNANFDKNDFVS